MLYGPAIAALLALASPSFHLVLSDGNDQLKGQSDRIAETIAKSFGKMEIDVTWSRDPSDPSLPAANVVHVIVLPRSSQEWHLSPGILAATRRDSNGKALIVVFYPEVERILNVRSPFAAQPIQGWRAPGRRVVNGVARVVVHEILHYFLPGRPHDTDGVFMDHVGNVLAHSTFEMNAETRDALVATLVREDREADSTR